MANRTSLGQFLPGHSGNPGGRPKKSLSFVLNSVLTLADKREIARRVKQAVIQGQISFSETRTLDLDFEQWFAFVQWLYTRMDGPPVPQEPGSANGSRGPIIIEVHPPGEDG